MSAGSATQRSSHAKRSRLIPLGQDRHASTAQDPRDRHAAATVVAGRRPDRALGRRVELAGDEPRHEAGVRREDLVGRDHREAVAEGDDDRCLHAREGCRAGRRDPGPRARPRRSAALCQWTRYRLPGVGRIGVDTGESGPRSRPGSSAGRSARRRSAGPSASRETGRRSARTPCDPPVRRLGLPSSLLLRGDVGRPVTRRILRVDPERNFGPDGTPRSGAAPPRFCHRRRRVGRASWSPPAGPGSHDGLHPERNAGLGRGRTGHQPAGAPPRALRAALDEGRLRPGGNVRGLHRPGGRTPGRLVRPRRGSVRGPRGRDPRGAARRDVRAAWADAFVATGASQCGFCSPGIVMKAEGLLAREDAPSRDEIARALAGNLCRCTGYVKIVDAIERVAADRRGEGPAGDTDRVERGEPRWRRPRAVSALGPTGSPGARWPSASSRSWPTCRSPGCSTARSASATTRGPVVRRIDTTRAATAPGVVAVVTAADVPGQRIVGLIARDWPVFVAEGETTRYVGRRAGGRRGPNAARGPRGGRADRGRVRGARAGRRPLCGPGSRAPPPSTPAATSSRRRSSAAVTPRRRWRTPLTWSATGSRPVRWSTPSWSRRPALAVPGACGAGGIRCSISSRRARAPGTTGARSQRSSASRRRPSGSPRSRPAAPSAARRTSPSRARPRCWRT